jgi:hypothetical protein
MQAHNYTTPFPSGASMSKSRIRPIRRRGISRIDQPSTRTHGWFVRAGFSKRPDGSYAPRHRKFFGDAGYGGKRRALRAAQEYLAIVQGGRRKAKARKVRRAA